MILANPARPPRTAPLARRRIATLTAAALAFGALYLWRTGDTVIADALVLLFVIPVAILALEFGVLGGLAGAITAIVLLAGWDASGAGGIAPLGYLARALAFLVLGAGIGRAAELRRRLEHDLLSARDTSLHMIATTSLDGVFRSLNPAWELALGVPRDALLGRPLMDFIHPDDLAAASAALVEVGHRDSVNFRGRFRDGRGGYRPLEWNARAQCGRGLMHVTARDLTVQCEAEELLAAHAETLERLVIERTGDLDHERLQTLQRLALAAEFRDDDTKQHTDRVGSSAAAIAVELGLRPALVARICEAAPLHDVGKIGICDTILLKPGRLTADELAEMRKHAQIGATILSGSDFAVLQLAEQIALTHHERWDGTGYPAGLAGRAIPIAGRIVAVADVFDALTHARPYKEAWPVAKALRAIHDGAGTHFDPDVVAAFKRLQTPAALRAAAAHTVLALAA
jgi:putative two-component system response regulator